MTPNDVAPVPSPTAAVLRAGWPKANGHRYALRRGSSNDQSVEIFTFGQNGMEKMETTPGHPAPITTWSREQTRAVVLAYRAALAEGHLDPVAFKRARFAFVEAGGDPEVAGTVIPRMIYSVSTFHHAWFWAPVKARLEWEERVLRATGQWPGPKHHAERQRLARDAGERLGLPPPWLTKPKRPDGP